jgi:uncharacterized protein YnzC (UPF0291/DUF896 family)
VRRPNWYNGIMTTATQNVIGQVLEPVFRTLPPDVAQRIIDLEADQQMQERVEELARKANEGDLTAAERREYESYISAANFLATLQAVARRTLGQTTGD